MANFGQRGLNAWWIFGILALATGVLGWLFYDSKQHQQQIAEELRNANVLIGAREREASQAQTRETELIRQLTQLQARNTNIDKQSQGQVEQLTQLRTELDQALEQKKTTEQQLLASQQALENTEQQLQASQSKPQEREQQISNLQQELSELKQQFASKSQQFADVEQQLAQKEQQTLLVQREVDQLKRQLSEAATTEQRYLAAREQLALRQAQNESYEDTVAKLQRQLKAEAAAMQALENSLQQQLLAMNQEKQQLVTKLEDGTTAIQFPESILFASGSARLSADGKRSLAQLTTALNSFPNYLVSVQGHSDSRSISPPTNQRYPTNWELSGARAATAVRHLIASGINKEQLQAVGYADARPLVPETSAANMQKNRRIEVILIPNSFSTKVMAAQQ